MKKIFLTALLFAGFVLTLSACDDIVTYDQDPYYEELQFNNGPASIDRITDILDREVSIHQCSLQQYVTLQGDNLLGTSRVVMNGVQINLKDISVRKREIVFMVPAQMPPLSQKDDKVIVSTPSGDLTVKLELLIPELKVGAIECEYLYPDQRLTILGSYFDIWIKEVRVEGVKALFEGFIDRLEIKIPDERIGKKSKIVLIDQYNKQITLPYYYNETEDILIDFEDAFWALNTLPSAVQYRVENGTNPKPLSGNNYSRAINYNNGVKLDLWKFMYLCKLANLVIPADIIQNPSKYVMKWEYYTNLNFSSHPLNVKIEPNNPWGIFQYDYTDLRNVKSDGKWHTMTVDFSKIPTITPSKDGKYFLTLGFKYATAEEVSMCVDNFRIVLKEELTTTSPNE